MKFELYTPCDVLKSYVDFLAIQETDEAGVYNVLPDTRLVIGFQYKGKLSYLDRDREVALAASGVTGLLDRHRFFKNSADTGTVLVFFKEGGAAVFFRQPIHELFNESISLDNFMLRSSLLLLEEELSEAGTDAARIAVIERFLVARLTPVAPDKLVPAALSLIHKSRGTIRIGELAAQLNISQSPLEKRFRKVVGTSPKKFASVVRLKCAMRQYSAGRSLTTLGYEAGFYDQAHFIREFKTFTGQTPERFFSSGR